MVRRGRTAGRAMYDASAVTSRGAVRVARHEAQMRRGWREAPLYLHKLFARLWLEYEHDCIIERPMT